jgi:hypothetical protein
MSKRVEGQPFPKKLKKSQIQAIKSEIILIPINRMVFKSPSL